ncbi:polar amino acid ABC transporter inner membrane subunit [Liquorilactobacillus mali KCTC 3596 = DSM 20444]|uniref:Polar amino acid ABC transporter inner membrane subunit n=2 Tax=Liquorilactobacillus mali TaxID=1618 RepID=A0A0R2E9P0_9LACO|nr:polar amino acid ABC transporter inner membrane subunit [Liquorilactobacillus mali KCTC 3596 = DSM 20444]
MGAVRTIVLTLISQCLAVILGLILELLRRTKKPITVKFVNFYIWLFRGIPVLVQLIFVYTALPQVGIKFDNFTSALIALTLNEAAYMAEIIRSGFDSVDGGQQKAAKMLGLSKTEIMKKITLPQALQVIVPPTANQFNGMLKTSALASVVGYSDLLLTAQQIASANFEYMSALTAAVIYYLIFTTIFTYVQKKAEQKFNYLQ